MPAALPRTEDAPRSRSNQPPRHRREATGLGRASVSERDQTAMNARSPLAAAAASGAAVSLFRRLKTAPTCEEGALAVHVAERRSFELGAHVSAALLAPRCRIDTSAGEGPVACTHTTIVHTGALSDQFDGKLTPDIIAACDGVASDDSAGKCTIMLAWGPESCNSEARSPIESYADKTGQLLYTLHVVAGSSQVISHKGQAMLFDAVPGNMGGVFEATGIEGPNKDQYDIQAKGSGELLVKQIAAGAAPYVVVMSKEASERSQLESKLMAEKGLTVRDVTPEIADDLAVVLAADGAQAGIDLSSVDSNLPHAITKDLVVLEVLTPVGERLSTVCITTHPCALRAAGNFTANVMDLSIVAATVLGAILNGAEGGRVDLSPLGIAYVESHRAMAARGGTNSHAKVAALKEDVGEERARALAAVAKLKRAEGDAAGWQQLPASVRSLAGLGMGGGNAQAAVATFKEDVGEERARALAFEAAQALARGDYEAHNKLPAPARTLAGQISSGSNSGNNAGVVPPTKPLPEGMRETPAWGDGRQHLAGLANKSKGYLEQNGLSFGVVLAFRDCGRLNMVSPVVRVSASGHILIRMDKNYQTTHSAKKGLLGLDTINKMTVSNFEEWVERAVAVNGAASGAGASRAAAPAAAAPDADGSAAAPAAVAAAPAAGCSATPAVARASGASAEAIKPPSGQVTHELETRSAGGDEGGEDGAGAEGPLAGVTMALPPDAPGGVPEMQERALSAASATDADDCLTLPTFCQMCQQTALSADEQHGQMCAACVAYDGLTHANGGASASGGGAGAGASSAAAPAKAAPVAGGSTTPAVTPASGKGASSGTGTDGDTGVLANLTNQPKLWWLAAPGQHDNPAKSKRTLAPSVRAQFVKKPRLVEGQQRLTQFL